MEYNKSNGHSFENIEAAIKDATKSSKPTLILCKTTIGFGSPNKSGKETAHGSLGTDEAKLTKEKLNWHYKSFEIPNKIKKWMKVGLNGKQKRLKWEKKLFKSKYYYDIKNQFKEKVINRDNETIDFLKGILKANKVEATRKSSQNSLEFFSKKINNFIGGSADLTGSNLTKTKYSKIDKNQFNYIHYGIREHLMAAAMNGIAAHKGFIPYGGTFLVFSDYCKNSIRLSAMMKKQVIYVLTHDSIGLGEDGPTHQPIEHLVALRSIPNLLVLRPCDAIETFESWEIAINTFNAPTAIILSRQNLPPLRKNININKSRYGGYF